MDKKYELVKTYDCGGNSSYSIRALRDFSDVKKGDIGGYVSGEHNLSHDGNCWIYGVSKVIDNAQIFDDVKIRGSCRIRDNATIYGNAVISDFSIVKDHAVISGNARVYGYAEIEDYAKVLGDAVISDKTLIHETAIVKDHAVISGNAIVSGNARVYGNAVIAENMHIGFSSVTTDLTNRINLADNIRAQTNLIPMDRKVIGYKYVSAGLTSMYDRFFQYTVGEIVEAIDPDISNASCASGLHFSHPSYWERCGGEVLIMVECDLDDIITVQAGKIRCKKLKVLGICHGNSY